MHYCAKKEKYVLLALQLQFQAYYSITHWEHEILEKKFDLWAVQPRVDKSPTRSEQDHRVAFRLWFKL